MTVSEEASDRKWNWHIPHERSFLEPKRNSSHKSLYHLNWDRHALLSWQTVAMHMPMGAWGFSSMLCLLLIAASLKCTHWTQRHMVDPQSYNLQKMIPWYSSNALIVEHGYFAWLFLLWKQSHHTVVINPENKNLV